MTIIKQSDIESKLEAYPYPRQQQSIIIEQGVVTLTVEFGFPIESLADLMESELRECLAPLGIARLEVLMRSKVKAHVSQLANQFIPQVKNIILVASGKGGVGKSTTAVNLALAAATMGAKVGLLDADIHGPNSNVMLGTQSQRVQSQEKRFIPLLAHGIQTISIANLVDMNVALAWRGPMISKVLEQLIQDTNWQALDYLFVDMPPGTGDIQLTIAKKVPVTGAVIVTTPQDVALHDVQRGIEMFQKMQVRVLGIIENMSQHVCSGCGQQEAIFGEQGGEALAAHYQLPLLGQLPLHRRIREDCDRGHPSVVAEPQGVIAQSFKNSMLQIFMAIARLKIDYSAKFAPISQQ